MPTPPNKYTISEPQRQMLFWGSQLIYCKQKIDELKAQRPLKDRHKPEWGASYHALNEEYNHALKQMQEIWYPGIGNIKVRAL